MHIDDLPVDIWPNIFRYLSYTDLFNCRLVNRKFKDFCNFTDGIYRLMISDLYNYEKDEYWFYNRQSINEENVISVKLFQLIKSLSIFNLDKYLKYLTIKTKFHFDLEQISYLTNLEYLDIDSSIYTKSNINFMNLKFLSIRSSNQYHYSSKLNLNTPRLEKIILDHNHGISNLNFQSDPKSIKHLILHNFEDQLIMFENLEILELYYLRSGNPLLIFNKLKKLKVKYNDFMNETKYNLANILNMNRNSTKNVDIYFSDLKVFDVQMIEAHYDCYNYVNLKYQLNNYDLLDLDVNKSNIQFNDLASFYSNIKNDLPIDFFEKYSNLATVNVTTKRPQFANTKNFGNLNWFLSNLKRKSIFLNLYQAHLSQNFFNNLPNVIRKLDINRNSIKLNYNFLFNLTKLNWFETDEKIDLFELILSLFLKLKYLKHFAFRFNFRKIRIERNNKNFRLLIGSKLVGKNLSYENLFELCNKIRSLSKDIEFFFE